MMRAIALAGLMTAGCGPAPVYEVLSGGDDPVTSGSTGTTSPNSSTSAATSTSTSTATATSTGSSSASSASSGGGTWPKPDVGAPTTGEAGQACNGKIDVALVISERSTTRAQLDEAIPKFAAIMQEEFADLDLHVMVVDPDGEWGDSSLCPKNKCPADGGCPVEPDFPCWALHDDDALTKCDNTMGAGVIFPAGDGTMNKPCGVEAGQRFITGDDPDFTDRFTCIAQPGDNKGGTIKHGTSLGRTLSWDLRLGCNQGFLRDDALLFAVQIVGWNEDDNGSFDWAQSVLEAKNNEQDLVVALAYSLEWKGYQPKPLCYPVNDIPLGHAKWVSYFDHHVFASRCEPNYVPFFAEAAAMAADLCKPPPE